MAGININPVAGLQQGFAAFALDGLDGRNQHQPSRGITTADALASMTDHDRRNQHQPSRGITTASLLANRISICGPESTSTQSRDYNSFGPSSGVRLM